MAMLAQSKTDTMYLKTFVREVKEEMAESGDLAMKQDAYLDSLLKEESIRISPGGILASPDGKFTLYQVEMESCGGYCNSAWYTRCVFTGTSPQEVFTLDLLPVDAIHPLGVNRYLLLQHGNAHHNTRP